MAPLHPALTNKSVSFKGEKVTSHRIVRKPELLCQLIDSAGTPTQQSDNAPSRAVEKPLTKFGRLHTSHYRIIQVFQRKTQ